MKNKKCGRSRAIKLYCKLNCCAGDRKSWVDCSVTSCYLYPFRMGAVRKSINKTVKEND